MKLVNNEVIDLMVFDENEELVAELDTLNNATIHFDSKEEVYLIGITDIAFDLSLQKFLHNEDKLTDFQLLSNGNKTTLRIGKPAVKKCKLIGKASPVELSEYDSKLMNFEAHNVEVANNVSLGFSVEKSSDYVYVFKVLPDKDGDYLKLNISN